MTKVEASMKKLKKKMQQQFDYCKALGKKWLPLIQANEYAIKDLNSKTENFISPNNNDSSQSIDFIINKHLTATTQGNVQVPLINSQHLALIDLLENRIEELET